MILGLENGDTYPYVYIVFLFIHAFSIFANMH